MDEPWHLGVADLRRAYSNDLITPAEVVEALLRRIGEVDRGLGAFTQVFWDAAMAEARRAPSPSQAPGLPLGGIPVAVKEIIDVAGAAITYGSDVFGDRVAAADAEVVRRLRAAGAIVVGITRSHEFAWGITTQHARRGGTRNPWDPERTPGGSSGGSAAAVSAGLVPLALGTDTGGSIRIPAAFTGVAGLKPSWGRVSKRGVLPLAPSLDHVGLLARSIEDLHVGSDVISGWDPEDPEGEPPPLASGEAGGTGEASLRLVVAPALHIPAMSASYAEAFQRCLDRVQAAGAVVDTSDASPAAGVASVFGPIQLAEAHHVHRRILKTYPARKLEYGPDVAQRLDMAAGVSVDDYLEARREMLEVRAMLRRVLEDHDALLLPVGAAGPSRIADPDLGEIDGTKVPLRDVVMNYTTPANLAGLPACVVLIGLDEGGVPIGVQVIGRLGEDARVLHIADQLRNVTASAVGSPLIASA
jgi:aspartyl-tRNA(Asn)/glutamyl-tRNA(Gln) amidotransferase subunit A